MTRSTLTHRPTNAQQSQAFEHAMQRALAQRSDAHTPQAQLAAVAAACRQQLDDRWAATQAQDAKRASGVRRVHYLSMEFLMGRAMSNALAALGLHDAPQARALSSALALEPDAALGNGGLGRLAACFLDSMATLELPSFGYGLRYEHGMFVQHIAQGRQVEVPDTWLQNGNPWEATRPELRFAVGFGGRVDVQGGMRQWKPAEVVIAQAHDIVVPGHNTEHVSTLRLWQAQAAKPIDYQAFSKGEYAASSAHITAANSLNWVLYPDDSTANGRELRLKQEFLLVSASLQDMIARHLREHSDIEQFGAHNVVHLNDTHPAIAPAELMRLLLDEHGLGWDDAWRVVQCAVSYTNHTLMPEALETWPVRLFEALLPRHLEIIYEINRRFLLEVRATHDADDDLIKRVSLIDEQGERRVRMAALAIVASRKVNGVSALHSALMVQTIFADYAKLTPEKFINVTNGVTPRRWLMQANPGLSSLLDTVLGTPWRSDLMQLQQLRDKAQDVQLGQQIMAVKHQNKLRLAEHIRHTLGMVVDANSLFDVQIKRIHEYKRQLLNVLHVVARYQAIIADPARDWTPRTVIIAGKAASAYVNAKRIIELVHDVARVINTDPRVGNKLKLVFLPNYSVSLAEIVLPAADLSEQISTAGTEASGTGNMKFAMNGALTIGTWDGANIEMAQAIGEDKLFVFGLRAEDVAKIKSLGYDPKLYVQENRQLSAVLDAIATGAFSRDEPSRYQALVQSLLQHDAYLLMADFASYVHSQAEVDALYAKPEQWAAHVMCNIAGMGEFSTDRTIREYVSKVWQA